MTMLPMFAGGVTIEVQRVAAVHKTLLTLCSHSYSITGPIATTVAILMIADSANATCKPCKYFGSITSNLAVSVIQECLSKYDMN